MDGELFPLNYLILIFHKIFSFLPVQHWLYIFLKIKGNIGTLLHRFILIYFTFFYFPHFSIFVWFDSFASIDSHESNSSGSQSVFHCYLHQSRKPHFLCGLFLVLNSTSLSNIIFLYLSGPLFLSHSYSFLLLLVAVSSTKWQ